MKMKRLSEMKCEDWLIVAAVVAAVIIGSYARADTTIDATTYCQKQAIAQGGEIATALQTRGRDTIAATFDNGGLTEWSDTGSYMRYLSKSVRDNPHTFAVRFGDGTTVLTYPKEAIKVGDAPTCESTAIN